MDVCVCVCHYTHTYIYIHICSIYIYTQKERQRERERKKETTLHAYTFQDIAWIQPFQLDHPRKCWENVMQIDWRLAGPCTPSCKRSPTQAFPGDQLGKKNKDPKKCKNSILCVCVNIYLSLSLSIAICQDCLQYLFRICIYIYLFIYSFIYLYIYLF